jgi:hypothetical protein
MTELIIENDVEKSKLDGLLLFLRSWGIEAKVRQSSRKYKVPDETSNILSFSDADDNCREIIMHIPSFVNVENIQRVIDLMVYKETTARSQPVTDEEFYKLSGAWESEQSAEEMVAELKAARKFRDKNIGF